MTVPLPIDAALVDVVPENAPVGVPGEAWATLQYVRAGGLRIGRNRTVHRVTTLDDDRGIAVPAPDCHQGYFPGGEPWHRRFTPTSEPVNCGNCLDKRRGSPTPGAAVNGGGAGQLALDLGELPA